MRTLPPAARVYVIAVLALGAAICGVTLSTLNLDRPLEFLALLFVAIVASIFKIAVPLPRALAHSPLTMSLSFGVNFAALLILGADKATIIAVAAAWSQTKFNARTRSPWYRTLFNMAALAVTMGVTDLVLVALGGTPGVWAGSSQLIALAGAAVAYYLVNSSLVAGAVATATGQPFVRLWLQNFVAGWISHLFGVGLAALGVVAMGQTAYWILPLVVAALVLVYRAYRSYVTRMEEQQRAVQKLSDLHLATVEALALAIDAKDQGSRLHLRRLQRHGMLLARAQGLDAAAVEAVGTAAMLHDIGMLAVPQHILAKGEALTDDERRKLWLHPQVGADIVRSVPFPAPVSPIILGHHERWDGRGYPAGLAGEDIPVGARILALVDQFDNILTTEPNLGPAEALNKLAPEAGRSLDPALFERFQALLPEVIRIEAELMTPSPEVELAGEPGEVRGTASPIEHIALAHREVYGLYDLSQALGATLTVPDAMQQLKERLAGLVPFTTCALFLHEVETGRTACRWLGGRDPDTVTAIANEFVDGPIAWVLDHGRSLITALPAALPSRRTDGPGAAKGTGIVEVLLCPLRVEDRTFGVLAAYHDRRGTYGDDHRRIFERVTEIVSAAIQNSLRYERTHEAALTDRLTGLANSRGLGAGFERALARAAHEHEPLAVLMVDIDQFKSINDTYGHEAGDRALKAVGRVLFHSVRPNDLCARYAGDEFVIILANCDVHQADRRAAELRREVAGVKFEPEPGRLAPLRISVGSAVYPEDGRSLDALLSMADRRMYSDKTAQRSGAARWIELAENQQRDADRAVVRE